MAKAKCACNFWQFLLGLVVFVLGFYAVIEGFRMHIFADVQLVETLAWYFGGFLLAKIGMWLKCSAHADCKVHGKK